MKTNYIWNKGLKYENFISEIFLKIDQIWTKFCISFGRENFIWQGSTCYAINAPHPLLELWGSFHVFRRRFDPIFLRIYQQAIFPMVQLMVFFGTWQEMISDRILICSYEKESKRRPRKLKQPNQ